MNNGSTQVMQRRPVEAAESVHPRTAPVEVPAVDIFESKDELLVLADLPGVTEESLNITFEKGKLTLEGRRSEPAGPNGGSAPGIEYRRTFLVPQGVDADKITAELKDGVLRVHLPKAAPFKPKQIKVNH